MRSLRVLAVALALALLAPGCVLRGESMVIAASAPRSASGMTVFLALDESPVGRFKERQAEYVVYYGDKLIYPPAGRGAGIPVDGRTGSQFVCYDLFVVGNGDYDVIVTYGDIKARARVNVQKWAEYVYLHPSDKGDTVQVEVALSSATGGSHHDRILAQGELVLTVRYRGETGTEDRVVASVTTTTKSDATSTLVHIPRGRFSAGTGYYSIEPLFHNAEAKNNVQVGPDPTMANRRPPWNWVFLTDGPV